MKEQVFTVRIETLIKEQEGMLNSERMSGNIVKQEFHKGAIFGLNLSRQASTAKPTADEFDQLKAENERLREALKPFADRYNKLSSAMKRNSGSILVETDSLKQAAEALEG